MFKRKLLFYLLGPVVCGVSLGCVISRYFSNYAQLIVQIAVIGIVGIIWFTKRIAKK